MFGLRKRAAGWKHERGKELFMQRRYGEAEAELRKAVFQRSEALGPDALDTLESMHWLIMALEALQNFPDMENECRTLLRRQQRVLGDDHDDTLYTMGQLVKALTAQHKTRQAFEMRKQIKEIEDQKDAVESDQPSQQQNHWVSGISEPGNLNDNLSQPLHERQPVPPVELPADEPITSAKDRLKARLKGSENEAPVLEEYSEAVESLSRLVQERKAAFGPLSEYTLEAKFRLAEALEKFGSRAEAKQLILEVISGQTDVLGPHQNATLHSRYLLGVIYKLLRNYAEAEAVLALVVEDQTQVFGKDDHRTIETLRQLQSARQLRGMTSSTSPGRSQALVESHSAKYQMAVRLHEQGKYEMAESMFKEAQQEREELLSHQSFVQGIRDAFEPDGMPNFDTYKLSTDIAKLKPGTINNSQHTTASLHRPTLSDSGQIDQKRWPFIHSTGARPGFPASMTDKSLQRSKSETELLIEDEGNTENKSVSKSASVNRLQVPRPRGRPRSSSETQGTSSTPGIIDMGGPFELDAGPRPLPNHLKMEDKPASEDPEVIETSTRDSENTPLDKKPNLAPEPAIPAVSIPQLNLPEMSLDDTRAIEPQPSLGSPNSDILHDADSKTPKAMRLEVETPGGLQVNIDSEEGFSDQSSLVGSEDPDHDESEVETTITSHTQQPNDNRSIGKVEDEQGVDFENGSPTVRSDKPLNGSSSRSAKDAKARAQKANDLETGEESQGMDIKQRASRRLNGYFRGRGSERTPFTDLEIQEISNLLKIIEPEWSKIPRTYIVLRTIDQLDLLDDFVICGFSDHWFPASEATLPYFVRSTVRASFVEAQDVVMTKSMGLEMGPTGQHCYFRRGDPKPFERKGFLGRGAFGQVDRVLSSISFKEYALKRVPRNLMFGAQRSVHMKAFVSEIKILKRVHHRHVVKFIGSYTDSKYMGLLMLPIAEMDLARYLRETPSSRFGELRTFFGCLTHALEYLHREDIRHKDIKPGNILVHHGNVLLTDFGLALDYSDATGSTSIGMVNGKSPRYCAPEVVLLEPRNTSSDMWSLGVVFLEILVVLHGETLDYIDRFFLGHGTHQAYVRTNRPAFMQLTKDLCSRESPKDNEPMEWVQLMLQEDPQERLTAAQLMARITDSDIAAHQGTIYCGICCMEPGGASFESDEDSDENSDDMSHGSP